MMKLLPLSSASTTPSEEIVAMKIDNFDAIGFFLKYLARDSSINVEKVKIIRSWWNQNMKKFPILSQVAKHVLAMSISTVALDSAFSTGGRVIDKYRSSLMPKTAQALICAQDCHEHIHSLVDLEHKREAPVVENPELVGV
ncbi:zinc finger BED domain-containing protein RICESLEEPER 2-like protein [Tanacetum coccineum]